MFGGTTCSSGPPNAAWFSLKYNEWVQGIKTSMCSNSRIPSKKWEFFPFLSLESTTLSVHNLQNHKILEAVINGHDEPSNIMHWDGHNITLVVFHPKMHSLNLFMKKYRKNPKWGTLYKITSQYSSKVSQSWNHPR